MHEPIEKLLILQDRDRKLAQLRAELEQIEPQRQALKSRDASAHKTLEAARLRAKQLETARKEMELEIEARKQQIERYLQQQLQTRKNEEYRALANEVETCKGQISQIEDRELEVLEQMDQNARDLAEAHAALAATEAMVGGELKTIDEREANLRRDLAALEANRNELAAAVEEGLRARYERLVRSKGHNVVVGVDHGACGGCHMRVPPQLLVHARAAQDIVTCPNCGRILYYTRGMDLAVAD